MIDGWHNRFTPLILARGRKYADEGRVHHLQCCQGTYFATVSGTEDYEVTIVTGHDDKLEMSCDCPYAYENHCKHMAAVLYALSGEDTCIEQLPPPKRPPIVPHIPVDWPWLEAIERLPEDVVRNELMALADRDLLRLRERLAILYLGRLPEHQLQNWKADLQDTAANFTNTRGRICGYDALDFQMELSDFLASKLPMLLEAGAVTDAFQLIWMVMETALEWELDDHELLADLFSDCEMALKKLLPMTTDTQKQQMVKWYRAKRNPDWPGDSAQLDQLFRKLFSESVPV